MKTFVIAIAGISGAGKSTLVKHLAAQLGNANSLMLDQYEASSFYPPAEKWIQNGADPNEFKIPQLDADAIALASGQSIPRPQTGAQIQPAPFLILEEPFGRGRDAVRNLIDFVVLVDTPLEVSYIRKISRKNDFFLWEDNPGQFMHNLRENMEWYLRVGRRFYLAVSDRVRKDCDFIVDGLLTTEELTAQIMQALKKKAII